MKLKMTVTAIALASSSAIAELPKLNLDIQQITVSGLSSGGYMAAQFHIAHSKWVSGAGIVAAGPYYCGQNKLMVALGNCVNTREDESDLTAIAQQVSVWQKSGLIDDTSNLANDKVWLLHGTKDQKVIAKVNDALAKQYGQWTEKANIAYVNDKPFSHHFPTESYGAACDQSTAPYLGNCGYDAAGEMLKHLKVAVVQPGASKGNLLAFDQQQLSNDKASGMADKGYVFIPESCEQGQSCKLHINFHGCNQYAGAENIGVKYVVNNGINRWAATNNTVVLYPQTKASKFMPMNPQGCWDWWGYTDEKYATKQGAQIEAVATMARKLAE